MKRCGVILEPQADLGEKALSNAGAYLLGDEILLLIRVDSDSESHIEWTVFDPKTKKVSRIHKPLIKPEGEEIGCEDPRIVFLDEPIQKFVITYTSVAPNGKTKKIRPYLALTTDFTKFEKKPIFNFQDKNAVFFPELINGEYWLLHRPLSLWPLSIWLTHSKSLNSFEKGEILFDPIYPWEGHRVGAGPPPIKTEKGWLLIYHGGKLSKARFPNKTYSLGVALLKSDDPRQVLSRCREPILKPEEDYEKNGLVPNVVFSCGAVLQDDVVDVFYGAADTCIAWASYTLDELFGYLDLN